MSRKWFSGHAVLLVVVTGLVVVSGTAAVGSLTVAGQHSATQSKSDVTAPGGGFSSGVTNTTSPTSDKGWTMSRANAANTNYINTTGPTNPITARWTFTSDANTFSAGPLVTNGTVYFATRYYTDQAGEPDGKLYAMDAWTGEVRWTFATSFGGYPNAIAVLRNTVYVGGDEGEVYALDAATGDEFWSFRASDVFGLHVANRTLFVRDRHTVYALGALRGEEKWRYKAPGRGRPTGVAVKAGTVYVSTKRAHVSALDAQTGTITWNTDLVEDIDIDNENDSTWLNTPVVANDLVYVGNRVFHKQFSDSNFYALDTQTGEARWTRTAPRADNFSDSAVAGFPAPSVRGDTLYLTGKHLRAVDAQTGTNRWSEPNLRGTPMLINDLGYIRKGGADGALYTLDPATGAHHARFSPEPFNNSWDRWRSGMAVLNRSLYTGVGIDVPEPNKKGHRSNYVIFYALGTPEFNYTNLSVTPSSPEINETVNVTATVRNTGTGPGTFNATLAVNGNITNATSARLDPRTNRTVTFNHTFQQNGTYTVAIANLTGTITVGNVPPATTPTATQQGLPDTPSQTAPAQETATEPGNDNTPSATSGAVPGFAVGGSVGAVVLVIMILGRRQWT